MPNKRALIVDDSSTAQYRLKKMLRSYNLDIDTADSGEAALRYLAHQSPDVIFMDHLMPGMDGFRALQIIKSHPETATIPVIMYTSKSGDLYTGQARALGALDVVSKDSINAADLSKVMEAIHVFRTKTTTTEEIPTVTDTVENLPDLPEVSEPKIDRRAPHPASVEQARNLELRLGHMELALEDNRRFITARVARELNSLRHSLKKEISELITTNQPPLENGEVYAPAAEPAKSGSVLGKLFWLAALITVIFFLVQISSMLSESKEQQQKLADQVAALAAQKPAATKLPSVGNAPTAAAVPNAAAPKGQAATTYLNDLAWTFNQNGQLPFYQNRIEPKKLIQLSEFLNRLGASGFKGSAWITLYVGNFCLTLDNYGVAQLPKDSANVNDCVFSSEIYGVDRIMEEYTHDTETALNSVDNNFKNIRLIISASSEPGNYPEQRTTLTAKAWNTAAQTHNRMEIRLEPATP